MADFNSMQANLGLIPGAGPQVQVKSPAQAAAELSQQASMQMQQAQSMMPVARSSAASFSFGQQYQQQFQSAQSQMGMNPYAANMFGSFTQPSALPSPMMMTPAHTGVFRPPMPYGSGAGGSPMSPMPVMPLFQTPFTPQMPAPSFRTPWEQEIQQRELRADQLYSMTAQTPRFGGMAAGYGMGAMAGAAAGSRFGAVGRGAGAVLGGIMAHYSGFAEGMGAMGMAPFRPGQEAHMMGLSSQRMSQDWVVGGSNLHQLGRGLSRDASMQLGRGIQSMSESSSFKAETGGMFNRHDLMQIMQGSGKAGLMDFDQSIDRIQEQLRKVSRTVSRFMELTNDPDVNSVIKRIGQMHTFGLSVPEIENAASSMRSFSRAAGTTVNGLYQQGLPGAMTYQGLGLSGGAGLQYGMYSAAAAKQAVASGTFTNAELAMFGGVQGVAQRNMQAQGAFMSMPMFGASVSSYGAGGWKMDPAALARMGSSGAGPQSMVLGAVSSMNAAVQSGGIGALAMMPLQQKAIADQAARTMSPYEQSAMRFSMAQNTGQFLGLKGAGAFAAGARMLYGDEVASQMMVEAANPEYWRSQKQMIRQERDQLARSQREEIMDAAPGMFTRATTGANRAVGRAFAGAFNPMADAGAAAGRGWRNWVSRPLQEQSDRANGVITRDRLDPSLSADTSSKEGRAAYAARRALVGAGGGGGGGGVNMTGRDAYDMMTSGTADYGGTMMDVGMMGLGTMFSGIGIVAAGASFAGVDVGGMMRGGVGSAYLAMYGDDPNHKAVIKEYQAEQRWSAARVKGAAGRKWSSGDYSALEKSLGLKKGQGAWAVHSAGKAMAKTAEGASGVFKDTDLTAEVFKNSMVRSLAASGEVSEDKVRAALTGDVFDSTFEAAYQAGRSGGGDTARSMFSKFEEGAAGGAARSSMVASRAEMDTIRARMDEREAGWGIGAFSGRDEFRTLVGKYSPTQALAIAFHSAGDLTNKQKDAWTRRMKQSLASQLGLQPDDPSLDGLVAEEVERMGNVKISAKLKGNIANIAATRGGSEQLMAEVSDITRMQISERTSGALVGINAALGLTDEDKMMKNESDLLGLSGDELRTLGARGYKGLENVLAKRGMTGEARLEALRGELDTIGMAGDSESLATATGDQANTLDRADKRLSDVASEMSEAFKPFAVATETFAKASSAFNDAMNARLARSGLGPLED